ncbi:MAG: hypothetical protein ACRCXX_14455 [Cetobacterium sp.]|uniref:hypothetical protein n=1 Tax=Cetobacterium sp. TaxID=2071632 RepID=UPI003F2C673E
MLSKAHIYLSKALKKLCKIYGVTLLEEVVNGSKRYDFYIPTLPPVVVEMDGVQHKDTKANSFFFKKFEQLQNYKKNDYERKKSARQGKIILFNFTTDEFPSLDELDALLGEYLNEGENEKDAYLIKRKTTERAELRKRELNKEQRAKAKEKNSNGNRLLNKVSGSICR